MSAYADIAGDGGVMDGWELFSLSGDGRRRREMILVTFRLVEKAISGSESSPPEDPGMPDRRFCQDLC